MNKLYSFIVPVILLASYQASVESYFSPSPDCENRIIEHIDNTKKTLDIMICSFTNGRIADAVMRAHDRGVKVRIIADRVQAAGQSSKIIRLYENGINVRVKSGSGIMHNKVAIFDNETYLTGSYNWTENASLRNDENCQFVSRNPDSLSLYRQKMEELWEKYNTKQSEEWLWERSKKINFFIRKLKTVTFFH